MSNLPHPSFAKRGFRVQLARLLGITHGAIYQWGEVPAQRVLDVERLTGIPRHELRPDLYPAPNHGAAA